MMNRYRKATVFWRNSLEKLKELPHLPLFRFLGMIGGVRLADADGIGRWKGIFETFLEFGLEITFDVLSLFVGFRMMVLIGHDPSEHIQR
jgi:hypothetical protein